MHFHRHKTDGPYRIVTSVTPATAGFLRPARPRPPVAPHARALPTAFLDEAIPALLAEARDGRDVQRIKRRLAAKHGLVEVPTNADVLAGAVGDARARLTPLLRMKPTRTLSGVAIVTVQASPAGCPHGTCTFCPGGPHNPAALEGIPVGPSAQSYTGREPAALRAARHAWDPYAQTAARLAELEATGHAVDKVDFIVQGGTFPARSPAYQREFLRRAFEALNRFEPRGGPGGGAGAGPVLGMVPGTLPGTGGGTGGGPPTGTPPAPPGPAPGPAPVPVPARAQARAPSSDPLTAAQLLNESAHARMVGLTIETKPDWCRRAHVETLLELGTTRVEIGVQAVHDDQLDRTRRGHTVADSIEATREAKDAGLKVCHHVMPGLPGWTRERDLESLRRILLDPDWSPDMLKIYPLLVMPGTPLWEEWQRGEYEPLDDAACVDLLAEAKALVPPHVRIQRIDRDIPTTLIAAGVGKSNVRELVLARMRERGHSCRCVRCRETGRVAGKTGPLELVRRTYAASGGIEHFLSMEDRERDALAAFVRVREPSPDAPPTVEGALLLRELRVVGREVPIDAEATEAAQSQHRGLGSRLLALAEDVARDRGLSRVLVTSGVGVRPYYAKRGYARAGPYMEKTL